MWDLIVSVPDHCLSFYSTKELMPSTEDRFFCLKHFTINIQFRNIVH